MRIRLAVYVQLLALALASSGMAQGEGPMQALLAARDAGVERVPLGIEGEGDGILEKLAGVSIFAYRIDPAGELEAVQVWPGPDVVAWEMPGLDRLALEREVTLGPLSVRMSLHVDDGAEHVEGSVLFMNDESVSPVGDVRFSWLGLGFLSGEAQVLSRYGIPWGVEPYWLPGSPEVSTWKLSRLTHLRGAGMAPLAFVLSWGEYSYSHRLMVAPDGVRRVGSFLIPPPVLSESEALDRVSAAEEAWGRFQTDVRTVSDPGWLFGLPKSIGAAGEQGHLGKHPAMNATHPQVASGFALDHLRGVEMYVEGRRKHWIDWPLLPSNSPDAGTNFDGLHFSSRWTAGYRWSGGRWEPRMGDAHGVSGYNLEHLRSRLPEIAHVSGDPMLLWMTSRLGVLVYNTLQTHSVRDGGSFGGGFSTMRGWSRPLAELMEVVAVLEAGGGERYAELAAFLRAHVEAKVSGLLEGRPRFSKVPDRPDEQIPGHEGEPITESWQAGIAGDYPYGWWLYSGSPAALALARQFQAANVESWRGSSVWDLEMAKQTLAEDWSIGRAYSRRMGGLVTWNRSLLEIPGLVGVDQERRRMCAAAVEIEYPGSLATKWGSGVWEDFTPMSFEVRRPWWMAK